MQKIFFFIVELFYWFLIFLSPTLGFGLIGLFLITALDSSIIALYVCLAVGPVIGAVWAERIRRKHGCSNYWSRIFSTPDIWPIDEDKKDSKKEK